MTGLGNNPDALKKILITCVYLDAANMATVLSRFPENIIDEICIVVDCPTENDLREIQNAAQGIRTRVRIIQNKERKGVGFAIKEGLKVAVEDNYDVVVLMAGNNKDDPREIPRLLSPILTEGYDYVQGSRFLPGGRRVKNPILRGLFSRLYPIAWTLLTNVRCTDVTNGFRAYRVNILTDERINIWQDWLNRYELEYYVHYQALTLGYKVKEVPVSKTYPYRHHGGYSRIRPLRDWWQIVGPLILLRLRIRK